MDIRHDESVQIRNETPRGPSQGATSEWPRTARNARWWTDNCSTATAACHGRTRNPSSKSA